MLVELKNGETLNGHLVTCDTWMNLTLKEVVQTSPVSFCATGSVVGVSGTCQGRKLIYCLRYRMATSSSDYLRSM